MLLSGIAFYKRFLVDGFLIEKEKKRTAFSAQANHHQHTTNYFKRCRLL